MIVLADDPWQVQKNGGNSSLGGRALVELIGHSSDYKEGRPSSNQDSNEKRDCQCRYGTNSWVGETLTHLQVHDPVSLQPQSCSGTAAHFKRKRRECPPGKNKSADSKGK